MPERDPLPGYELLEVLGEGGMATVFKARQRATGRLCALKILRQFDLPEDRREHRLEGFARESKILSLVDHPNVVRMLAQGRDEGGAWIALEYVDGPSLEELLEREGGPLAPGVVLALVHEVARALAHLAAKRVVHRDVKPANVVITGGGAVKLLDFGIARIQGEDESEAARERIVADGCPIGTIDYLAPEQIEGDSLDERVDIFALGTTAYRCLAGMTPFTGETVFARLRQLVEREPPPLPRAVPEPLSQLVLELLSKKPDSRPRAKDVAARAERLARELAGLDGEGWTRRALVDVLSRPKRRKAKRSAQEPLVLVLRADELTIERKLALGERVVIGRSLQDGQASTSIGRPWISRKHCSLELAERGFVVTDLGSANGTFVNQLKVDGQSSALLRPGDQLTLGKTVMTVSVENAPPELYQPLWKCLLCQVELPRDAGSHDNATGIEDRHLCGRCRARIEEDRATAERRAREALLALGVSVQRRLELGGPILRFDVADATGKRLGAHALDLGPSAANLYVERSKTALALDHPGILRARAVKAASGILAILTDPIEGRTAADVVLRDGPLATKAAVAATIVLARAVAHARARGVSSVAVRPGLILLSQRGEPKLLDAGLAPGLVEAGRSRVELGRSLPSYDAPEVAEGGREPTPRALVYSVAGIAYFLLTSEPPAELRSDARRIKAPTLASRTEGFPARLAQVIDASLDPDPDKRPADLEEMARALEAFSREAFPAAASDRPPAVKRFSDRATQSLAALPRMQPGDVSPADDSQDARSTDVQRIEEITDEEIEPARTMILKIPPRSTARAPLPPPSAPLPPMPRAPEISPAPRSPAAHAAELRPASVKVDLAARLERLARDRATGVLTIEAARARARIELRKGRIVRVDAPASIATGALAAVLAAREAVTNFEPDARLEPTAAEVDLSVGEALALARGEPDA